MKYYLDTEFAEKPSTIKLISIGIASEDGRTLYAENCEFDPDHANDWVKANVLPKLRGGAIPRAAIRDNIIAFVGDDTSPEFWGYYADYDWVVFCWLFGTMMDLPKHFPMFCRDLKQALVERGNPRIPFKCDGEHNALADAQWIRASHVWLIAKND